MMVAARISYVCCLFSFVAVSGSLDDANKLQHMQNATTRPDAFSKTLLAEDDLLAALDWVLEHSAEEVAHNGYISAPHATNLGALLCSQVNSFREDIISRIEDRAQLLRATGMCEDWFAGADPAVASVQCLPPSVSITTCLRTHIFACAGGI